MTTGRRALAAIAILVAIVALAVAGERIAPPVQAPVAADSRKQKCSVDAPEPLHAAAKEWCGNGLFLKVTVTTEGKDVIGAMQFTPNGAQSWELQSPLLIGDFRRLTDQLASAAAGRDVSVSLNDAGDRRVGACARAATDTTAACSPK